jgi:lipopolysaccharide transport system permease protein
MSEPENWDIIVKPKSRFFQTNLSEVIRYRDLVGLFVKRDFVSVYRQTILGPLWYLIQPLLTTVTFSIIFGNIANIPTAGLPAPLFYISGLTIWNFFSACIVKSSTIFVSNAGVFGKVYFPRLTVPIANTISNFISFGIQLLIMMLLWLYYQRSGNYSLQATHLLVLPLLLMMTALMGASFGILVSALTTKYRDFSFLLSFAVQLLMYLSPVIYSKDFVTGKFKVLMTINPVSDYIEYFRFMFTGSGTVNYSMLAIKSAFAILLCFFSIVIFNRTERSFMDTV